MEEGKLKHLEMVQGIINRMANNSFMLKGWAVTLVSGIFVLSSRETDNLSILVTFIPIITFWGLDSYYLMQERLYRSLYDKIRGTVNNDIDFSLKATLSEFSDKRNKFLNCLVSKTESCFYLSLTLGCTIIVIVKSL